MAGEVHPAESRNLPEDYYGGFDVRQMPDSSKRYRLPHTLYGTVMPLVTGAAVLGVVVLVTGAAVMTLGVPIEPAWFGSAVAFVGLHAAMTILVTLWALLTGYRRQTFITIRADGLVWNDKHFFPASHIWSIGYGTTTNGGKPDESFEPLIEIQVGVKTVVLADHLDAAAGKMFEHFFRNDTRRYWYGHN